MLADPRPFPERSSKLSSSNRLHIDPPSSAWLANHSGSETQSKPPHSGELIPAEKKNDIVPVARKFASMTMDSDRKIMNSTLPWPKDVTAEAFKTHSAVFVGEDQTAYVKSLLSIRSFVGAGLLLAAFLPRKLIMIGAGLFLLPQLIVTFARYIGIVDDPLRKVHPVLRGRWTAQIEGSFCVFHIGFILNGYVPNKEMQQAKLAMESMIKELEADPQKFGYLGGQSYISSNIRVGGGTIIQYWRSQEQLNAYARDGMRKHFPAMIWSSKTVQLSPHLGLWHESFCVREGEYECIYTNCPQMLLGKASSVVPAVGTRRTARGRLRKTDGTDLNELNLPESYFE